MKKIFSSQSAQIGIAAVLLTTVLLAIGVSVTTRVSDQVSQETQRSESQQALESAIGQADIASNLASPTTNTTITTPTQNNTVATKQDNTTDGQSIYLNAGETVEIKLDGTMKDIFWEIGNNACNAALLLGHYNGNTVNYYPIRGKGCPATGTLVGYDEASTGTNGFKNRFINTAINSGTLRIKVLFQGTYLKMDGLISTTRAAASNEGGNEVRVVEQYQTTDNAAPSIMDFALFAGGGSITKQ